MIFVAVLLALGVSVKSTLQESYGFKMMEGGSKNL